MWRAVVTFFLLFYSVGAPNTGESHYQINLLSFHYMHWEVAGFQIRYLKLIQIFSTKFTNGHILNAFNAFFFNKNIKFCRSWSATLYIKSQKKIFYTWQIVLYRHAQSLNLNMKLSRFLIDCSVKLVATNKNISIWGKTNNLCIIFFFCVKQPCLKILQSIVLY